MELRQLETFVAVAEAQGLGAAASALGVSVSTVSERLAALERSLGCRLLHRTTRRLSISAAGEALLPLAHGVVDAAARVRSSAREACRKRAGVLRVATVAAGRAHAVRVAGALRRGLPGWDVRVDVVTYRQALDGLRHREYDLVLGRPRCDPAAVARVALSGNREHGTVAWRIDRADLPVEGIRRAVVPLGVVARRRPRRAVGELSSAGRSVARVMGLVDRLAAQAQ